MLLRWIHKAWKFFWAAAWILLIVVLAAGGIAFGVLQTEFSRQFVVDRLERDFRNNYPSELDIGSLEGVLPFSARLDSVTLRHASAENRPTDTLVTIEQVELRIDTWNLLRKTLSVTGFTVKNPRVRLAGREGRSSLAEALTPRQAGETDWLSWIREIEILAPDVRISGGSLLVENHGCCGTPAVNLPDPLRVDSINAGFFLELNAQQRFWDIQSLELQVEGLRAGYIEASGQIYNDRRYLEFNGFGIRAGGSELRISGEIDGVDLYAGEVSRQLAGARYDLSLQSSRLLPGDLGSLFPDLSGVEEPFDFRFHAEGGLDSLYVDEVRMGFGESTLSGGGFVANPGRSERFRYRASLLNLVLHRSDMERLTGPLPTTVPAALQELRAGGTISGSADSTEVELQLRSPLHGELRLSGGTRIAPPYRYDLSLKGSEVDLAPLAGYERDSTRLYFEGSFAGNGLDPGEAAADFSAEFTESSAFGMPVDRLTLSGSLSGGSLEHRYAFRSGRQELDGTGSVDFSGEQPVFNLKGSAGSLDIGRLFPRLPVSPTDLSMEYSAEFQGRSMDILQGRANLDITRAVVEGDTLRPHQFYVDIDEPDQESRTLRLTSSFFDLTLDGTIVPSEIYRQGGYWADYALRQFRQEMLLEEPDTLRAAVAPERPLSLEGSLRFRNLDLLRHYLPGLPEIRTDATLSFNANTSGERLLLNTSLNADTLRYGSSELRESELQLTASLRSDRLLKEYASLDFQSRFGQIDAGVLQLDSAATGLTVSRDSIRFRQQIGSIGGEADLDVEMEAVYSDSLLSTRITRFLAGNETYAWSAQDVPRLLFNRSGEVTFEDFVFRSRDEFLRVDGTMSPLPEKSLEYTIRNVSLGRISSLIRGEHEFAGELNGNLLTRSLTRQPSVQGELTVDRFTLNGRPVGDVRFNSRLNEQRDRFDTRIDILTDSTRYGEYLAENDQVGQNIRLDGWFVPPDLDQPQDTVYHFNADFREIDLWVLTPLLNPLQQVEGEGSGEGWLTGNLREYDFNAGFQVSDVYLRPKFLDTDYYVSGPVAFDRHEGVRLDSLDVRDEQGGTGTLWGTVDLNDFRPITYLDLVLDMNELRFLNNSYDPDVPFYGSVAGTGRARLSGSNTDLVLRTEQEVEVTSDSRVSIPLMEETELSEGSSFIRFVDTFDLTDDSLGAGGGELTGPEPSGEMGDEALEAVLANLTFNERFDLDLQFHASENVNVELIFDRVVGEVLSSRGSGQMRLTMQDEQVQMFGQYEITGGSYQFVTGEIISRQLDLEPGGTITWQGNPDNAQLDISAVYRARPDVSMLNYRGSGTPEDALEEGGRRVPVELVVDITGTVGSVSNSYYFRLPNSLELSSNSTLSYTISQINRDEQQKLLQATSILLSDRFIPVQGTDQATSNLSQSLTRGSAVINPLISNQVISPLLSNQINSLLNNDVSRFDIDFNLNTYNEIDLGIALRLYNDRLILRREGQITGETTIGERIGDLNATYRLGRGLSLTAFHRQDQVFGSVATNSRTGEVTPSVDGLGLEAEMQFNTWEGLMRRIGNFFRGLFGGGREEGTGD